MCLLCQGQSVHRDIMFLLLSGTECDPACIGVGRGWCYGHSSSECCSYFLDDQCVGDCGDRREPGNDFECACSGSWREPTCTSKTVMYELCISVSMFISNCIYAHNCVRFVECRKGVQVFGLCTCYDVGVYA